MTAPRWFVFAHEVGAAATPSVKHDRPLLALHLSEIAVDWKPFGWPVPEPICKAPSARIVGPIDQPAGFALACVECLRRIGGVVMLTDEGRLLLRVLCASKASGRDSSGGYRRDIDARLVLMLLDDYDRIRPVYDAAVALCEATFADDMVAGAVRAVARLHDAVGKALAADTRPTPQPAAPTGRTGST